MNSELNWYLLFSRFPSDDKCPTHGKLLTELCRISDQIGSKSDVG